VSDRIRFTLWKSCSSLAALLLLADSRPAPNVWPGAGLEFVGYAMIRAAWVGWRSPPSSCTPPFYTRCFPAFTAAAMQWHGSRRRWFRFPFAEETGYGSPTIQP